MTYPPIKYLNDKYLKIIFCALLYLLPTVGQAVNIDSLVKNADINIIHGNSHIYLSGKSLIYLIDTSTTSIAGTFFVHILPLDFNDLPENQKKDNFDNLDFTPINNDINTEDPLYQKYVIFIRDLPQYPIKAISTGIYDRGGIKWKEFFPLKYYITWQIYHKYIGLLFTSIVIGLLLCLIYSLSNKKTSINQSLILIASFLIVVSLFSHTIWISYAVGLLLLIILFFAIKQQQITASPSILTIFFGLYIVRIIGLSYTSNFNYGLSFLETEASFLIFPCIAFCINVTKEQIKLLLKAYLWLISLFIFFCFITLGVNIYAFQLDSYDLKNWAEYLFTWLPNQHPSYYAVMTLFAIPVWCYLYYKPEQWKSIVYLILFSLYIGAFVLCSGARIAILTFPLLLSLCWVYYSQWKSRITKSCIAIGTIVVIGSTAIYINPELPAKFLDPCRVQMWTTAIHSISEHPWLGLGTGGNPPVIQSNEYAHALGYENGLPFGSPHNQFLDEWMQYGLVFGSVLFVAFVWLVVLAIRKKDFLLLAFMLIEIMFLLVETALGRAQGIVFFMFWVSILIATQQVRLIPLTKYK